ncbi:GGDEF domain-containing protein [Zooshikella sp. RANM57]|uniref:GGDEF domain-containing protein n=1 Tax=Zooshikella sp. RANM57 TaxID=3425863 RepID=UPI003D6F9262
MTIDRTFQEAQQIFFKVDACLLTSNSSEGLFKRLLQAGLKYFNTDVAWYTLTPHIPISSINFPTCVPKWLYSHSLFQTESIVQQLMDESPNGLHLLRQQKQLCIIPTKYINRIDGIFMLPVYFQDKLVAVLNLGFKKSKLNWFQTVSPLFNQLATKVTLLLALLNKHDNLQYLAQRDPLTNLYNRRVMLDHIQNELTRCERYQASLAILFIDCDDFKQINDQFGHDCGDAVLQHLAYVFQKTLRRSDQAFRYAGDEFVITLPNQSMNDAQAVSRRLKKAIVKEPLIYQERAIPISISCGAATYLKDVTWNAEVLLNQADQQLLQQKRNKISSLASSPLMPTPICSTKQPVSANQNHSLQF